MLQTFEVEIDANGAVRPLESSLHLPPGRALLTLLTPVPDDATLPAEHALAHDWSRPEEDAAWAHLQPAK